MIALAWRIDKRLTLLYYGSAFIGALAPLAAGITLATLIDHVVVAKTVEATVVAVVAMHFAIVAVNAAVRFGLHEQYYDYLFRYRLQN